MRIKLDFVTNSSTTSFVGWGIQLDSDNIYNDETILEKAYTSSEFLREEFDSIEDLKEKGSMYDILESLPFKILEFGICYDTVYIAGNPNKMQDNETLLEFKNKIFLELTRLGFDVDKVKYIQEAWGEY